VNHLIVAGAIEYAATHIGIGVGPNSLFDWLVAASVATGMLLSGIAEARFGLPFGTERTLAGIVLLLVLRVLLPPAQFVQLRTGLSADRRVAAAIAPDISFMRTRNGPALCEDLAICYWSGHQSGYSQFGASQALITGARTTEDLNKRIRSGEFRLLQIESGSPLLPTVESAGIYWHFDTVAYRSIFFR
jgi:hypothetical protein